MTAAGADKCKGGQAKEGPQLQARAKPAVETPADEGPATDGGAEAEAEAGEQGAGAPGGAPAEPVALPAQAPVLLWHPSAAQLQALGVALQQLDAWFVGECPHGWWCAAALWVVLAVCRVFEVKGLGFITLKLYTLLGVHFVSRRCG